MAEEIKDLIAKIQKEGIQAAEDKAKEIELKAKQQAEELMKKARAEAEHIIAEANEQSVKTAANTKTLLQQAARDMMLGLRKEIDAMLERLIVAGAREALKPQELIKIIASVIGSYDKEGKNTIVITANKLDLEKLQEGILGELGREVKKGITFKGKDGISSGFTISFDAGKSHFDFTDQALAEYIGSYLKPRLKETLS